MGLDAAAIRRAAQQGSRELLEMRVDDAARDAPPPGVHADERDALAFRRRAYVD